MKSKLKQWFFLATLLIGLNLTSQVNLPLLMFNAPINTVAGTYTFNLINSCSSQDYHVISTPTNGGLIPVASGVQLVLKISSINIAFPSVSLTCLQTGTVPVIAGNSYTFTTANTDYQFTCVGPATVICEFLLVGTPTVSSELYECGYDMSLTLSNCQNQAIISGFTKMPIISSNTFCNVAISDGLNETGIKNSIVIFPNPSGGEFNLILKAISENTTMELYDATGKLVIKKSIKELNSKINLGINSKGIYFMKIKDGSTLLNNERIIVH